MQSLRTSLSFVSSSSRVRLGMGANALRLRPIRRTYIQPLSTTATARTTARTAGVRWFSLSRPRCKGEKPLERLEIREGEKLHGKPDGKKRLDDFNKGKLLTTPSRLFKLLMPLTTIEHNTQHRDIEPIAVLIHPHQPLSYLERLIQSEVPRIRGENGQLRVPSVSFIALQLEEDAIKPRKPMYDNTDTEARKLGSDEAQAMVERRNRESKVPHNKNNDDDDAAAAATTTAAAAAPGTYSYLRGTTAQSGEEQRFVRWSQSTEIGDFIRDAARAQEFVISIEGAPAGQGHIRVTVPSFNERTYYLRMRLRKISQRIQSIADIKHDCDVVAHRGAQRVAIGGFGVLSFWWCLVYKLTFGTELGWDTMEPVTYLASLSTLMGGYLWFLYHNREISYKSALDFTISARQKKLYQTRGVDLRVWESLIDEGNTIRKEIKNIAAEYDVEWDEIQDEQDERVTNALRKERHQKNGNREQRNNDDDDEDDDDNDRGGKRND